MVSVAPLTYLGESADKADEPHHLLVGPAPALFEAGKQMVEVFCVKLPGQLGQQVVDVLDNDLKLVLL